VVYDTALISSVIKFKDLSQYLSPDIALLIDQLLYIYIPGAIAWLGAIE